MPRVSIVMTCFNHERFVTAAISSIIRQDYSDWELLVIDDGSIDRSVSLARGFDDPRITVIAQENGGPSDAWNVGIAQANGEFIILASADDEFEESLVSRQVTAIAAEEADVSFCLPTLIDEQGAAISDELRSVFFKATFQNQEEVYFKLFSLGNFLLAPGALIRRSLFTRFGPLQTALYQLQDFDLWVRLAPHCKMIHLTERLIRYRLMADNSNLSARPDPFYIAAEYRLIYQNFFNHVPRAFLRNAFQHVIDICEPGDEDDLALESALLLMSNRRAEIQALGLERAMAAMSRPAAKNKFLSRFDIGPAELRRLAKGISGADPFQSEIWGRHNVRLPARKGKAGPARRILRWLRGLRRRR